MNAQVLEITEETGSGRSGSSEVAKALAKIDRGAIAADYEKFHSLFWREGFLPQSLVDGYAAEADQLRSRVVRKRVPGYKKSGSVSYFDLLEAAPKIISLYKDPALIAYLSELAGAPLMICPDDDPHAAALYYYTEAEDGIGFHYDSSHYEGDRYTVLVGLVNKSERAKLIVHPNRKSGGEHVEYQVATHPGTFVFFNGNNIWHSVSPIGENEERIVLTLEYVTNPSMTPFRRFISNMKDALTYFGWKGILSRPRAGQKPA